MPVVYKKTKPDKHPKLIEELKRVLHENKRKGAPKDPLIVIEEIPHSDSTHVTVIWEKWKDIDAEERGRIILNAIAEEKGEAEMLRVTMALGLTKDEAKLLGIS